MKRDPQTFVTLTGLGVLGCVLGLVISAASDDTPAMWFAGRVLLVAGLMLTVVAVIACGVALAQPRSDPDMRKDPPLPRGE